MAATENTEAQAQPSVGAPVPWASAQVSTCPNGRFPSSSNILSAFLT